MLIDSHCHLTENELISDVNEVIASAKNSGVDKIITVGTNIADNKKVLNLAKRFDMVYAIVGIYPHEDIGVNVSELINSLEENIGNSTKVVGVGETGIDLGVTKSGRTLKEQQELFEEHIKLALKHNLPLVIHNRNGDKQVLNILKKYSDEGLRGVMHCYTSNWDYAKKLLKIGFYISFTGIITYKSGKTIHETVKNVPLDKFLLETDAPWLSPEGFRNSKNKPEYVKITAQEMARIKGIPLQKVEERSYHNTCKLFNLPTKDDF